MIEIPMNLIQFILLIAGVIGALLAIGASGVVIYAAFKKAKNDENRKADRELIDTLKTQNELLRQQDGDNAAKLNTAVNDIAELRGELRTIKDIPLAEIAQALGSIPAALTIILNNQRRAFEKMDIDGFQELDNKGGNQP